MRRLLLAVPVLVLVLLHGPPALAWEETGHRIVATVAAQSFPAEIPAFLRTPQAVMLSSELTREPDRSKGAGQPHDADLDPGHFVDIDDDGKVLGGPSLSALPANRRQYEQALQAVKTDSWNAGWLPYNIVDGYQQLVKDFAYWRADGLGAKHGKTPAQRAWFVRDGREREQLILRDLGYWSHFVGDGSQPLHASVHYNGWGDYPNPNNYTQEHIHLPFEGPFVRDNASVAAVKAALPPPHACGCSPAAETGQFLLASAAKVEPLYQLWAAGGFKDHDPRGTAFVVERLAAGAAQLRDFVTEAWRASEDETVGYPGTAVRTIEQSGVIPYDTIYGRD